jgi:hypothetical protein
MSHNKLVTMNLPDKAMVRSSSSFNISKTRVAPFSPPTATPQIGGLPTKTCPMKSLLNYD